MCGWWCSTTTTKPYDRHSYERRGLWSWYYNSEIDYGAGELMRRLFITVLFTLLCQTTAFGIAVVQHKNNQGVGTAVTVTPTSAVTAGNFVAVLIYEDASNTSTLSTTDSNSQTWLTAQTVVSGNSVTGLFYKENSAAITTATCNSTTSATVACYIYEFSAVSTSSSLDGVVTSSGSSSSASLASGSLTTTQTVSVLIYGCGQGTTQSGAWTGGSGYTIDTAPNPNSRDNIQYKIVGAVQTGVTTTMTWATGATDRGCIFAAFASTPVGATRKKPPVVL